MTDDSYSPISPTVSAEQIAQSRQNVRVQIDEVGLRTGAKAEFTFLASVSRAGLRSSDNVRSRHPPLSAAQERATKGRLRAATC